GDPDLITLKGARLLGSCPVIAYPAPLEGDSLARTIAAPHIPDGRTEIAIRMPIEASRFPAQDVYAQAAIEIGAHSKAGRDVAVLCEGDPFFYGSFMYLFARLADAHKVEVVPGVSSLTACAAVLAAPLAARNDVFSVIPAPLGEAELIERIGASDSAAIIKLGRHFTKVRDVLRQLGLSAQARYVERATLPAQQILPLDEVDAARVPYFSMILVHRRRDAWL
ncbi:MAG: precorrin-2 C(20)-methyltransferase, partial [Alphaproteobacteria bacterium]